MRAKTHLHVAVLTTALAYLIGLLSTMAAAQPAVSIHTDAEAYQSGDTIEVSLSGENDSGGMFVAVYVGLFAPDGRLFTFRDGDWAEDVLPWIDEIYVPEAFMMDPTPFWWFTIPCTTPPIGDVGGYNFAAGLTIPGTSEFVSDVSFAPFQITAGQGIPTAIIEDIRPNPATQGVDVIEFLGRGEDDGEVVAYEWRSNMDGLLSEQEAFTCPACDLSIGVHLISFKVCDDEGNWSEEDSRELTVQTDATGTVEGRVCEVGTETLIEGASVYIGQISDATGANGLYSLEGVPLGEHTINAEFPGFEFYEATITVLEGSNTHHIYMTPLAGETSLGGAVTDWADSPVAGARVDVAGETAHTDGSGHYEFLGLTQGAYTIRVSEVDCHDDYDADIELNAAEVTHDVRLSLTPLPAPDGLAATADAFLLNSVSWNPVECAVRYNVYVSTDSGTSSTLLGQVSPPETGCEHWLDSNCSDLWYSVACIGLDGREAEAAQWVQVSPIRTLQVDADTTLSGELCFEESLVISDPAVLTVSPGSTLRFADGCGIDVYGGLTAQGDAQSGIVIEGIGGTAVWGHLAFYGTSDPQSCKLRYVTIQGGTADCGGAIFCSSASPTIEYCTMTGNTAAAQGGGMYCRGVGCSPTITGSTISGNSASSGGGGICCWADSSPAITGNSISDNEASDGGGIYGWDGSSMTIRGNSISDNKAYLGGGISCYRNSPTTITDNTITGNKAGAGGGGGICCYESAPSIQRNTITGNLAGQGGGVLSFGDSPSIKDNTISNNRALNNGGGISCKYHTSSIIEGNTITNNLGVLGGGICCEGSCYPTIEDNTISNNIAGHGGGLYSTLSWPTIRGNKIMDNLSNGGGGGIFCYEDSASQSPIIFNNLIARNMTWMEGAGVYTEFSSPRMNNNTIADNLADKNVGGILNVGSPGPTVFDCILWGNTGDLDGCTNVTFSCIEDGFAGTGNIQSRPQFDGPFGCYYLKPTSPCIDKGSQPAENAGVSQRTTQVDNTPDTGTVDMGYHYPIADARH
ncbi:MAG: right-handed parallel beta-helix repeat-containing protein [Candidatus Coatesbacteria bacterium]|nr:right-handed parallel beta-helix repeat-containing protein [Candidatus Coatesbacteria bacterium]